MPQETVLIIGGGVAGTLTALFLKQNGFSPQVYERVTALADVGVRIDNYHCIETAYLLIFLSVCHFNLLESIVSENFLYKNIFY
jgi:cation diffusion facilitator CzcD-associated flavoprotein CzcO